MLSKVPLLIVVVVIIFLITSLMTYITMEKVVAQEKIEVEKTQSSAAGIVQISIVHPEKEAVNSGANIK